MHIAQQRFLKFFLSLFKVSGVFTYTIEVRLTVPLLLPGHKGKLLPSFPGS